MRRVVLGIIALLSFLGLACAGDDPGGLALCDGTRYPLKRTEVRARITGPVVKVTLRQEFLNPFAEAVGVVYSFPLPDCAAVDDFRAEIGNHLLRAEVMERGRAAEKYRDADQAGHTAALLEQIRPNLFTQRISLIPEGEEIAVELTYVEELEYEKGGYLFHLPVVVGPRYARAAGDESELVDDPGSELDIEVVVEAGVEIADLFSKTHAIDVRYEGDSAVVTLDPTDTLPDKDFELAIRLAPEGTEAALFAHRTGAEGYFSLLIHPDDDPTVAEVWAREMVFVIDCSGSMAGMPNDTAKKIVEKTLRTLRPSDTFQILRFSDTASGMGPTPVPASYANIQKGLAFVRRLKGEGGTEMISGIRLALQGPRDPDRLRIVHFLTDGLIGNEPLVLGELRKLVGDARVFPLGVGSSVNRFLIERMAELGRGTAAYIQYDAPDSFIKREVDRFVARVRTPVVTDLEIDWGGLPVYDVVPARLPDGFCGRPLLFHGKYDGHGAATVILRGRQGGGVYRRDIEVVLPEFERANSALGKLWARTKIRELMLGKYGGDFPDTDAEVLRLALEHRLLTAQTAFVAVDETVVNGAVDKRTIRQPSAWPQGVGGGRFFGILLGDVPQGAYLPPATDVAAQSEPSGPPGPSRTGFRRNDALPGMHLLWLERFQQRDGSYKARGELVGDVGATALAVLAHHACGVGPEDESLSGKTLRKALRFLRRARDREGCYGARSGRGWVLDHALATLAALELCEKDGPRSARRDLEASVRFLVSRQSCGLGWSRDDSQAGGDSLTTAIVAFALTRAKALGIPVDPIAFQGIENWFTWATDESTGLVRMTLHSDPFTANGTAIACGILARHLMGPSARERNAMLLGSRRLLDLPWPVGDDSDPLYLFLATSALRAQGGAAWNVWRPPLDESMRKAIVPEHATDDGGDPILVGHGGERIGRAAAMALFGMTRSIYDTGGRPFTVR